MKSYVSYGLLERLFFTNNNEYTNYNDFVGKVIMEVKIVINYHKQILIKVSWIYK